MALFSKQSSIKYTYMYTYGGTEVTCVCSYLSRAHDILSRAHELICRAHDIISQSVKH